MNNMPKISVIVPVYNVEKYLDRCMQNLLNQTLQDIEIILVDDESPDNAPKMCDNYAQSDSRVHVIHKKNQGLGLARNSGLAIAKGEFVAFVDSDDYIDLNTFEWLYNQSLKNSFDAIFYRFKQFSDVKDVKIEYPRDTVKAYVGKEETQLLAMEMIASLPSEKNDRNVEMSSCTAFYKRSIIEKFNIRFHSERELISEDLIFNIDFLQNAQKVARSPNEFYHYYVNNASLTHKVRFDRIDKNILFYHYISEKIKTMPNVKVEDQQRAMRMLLGYCRSSIFQVLKSNCCKKEKDKWLKHVCSYSIWNEIYHSYPVSKLPLKYFFLVWAKCKKQYWLIKLMAKFV